LTPTMCLHCSKVNNEIKLTTPPPPVVKETMYQVKQTDRLAERVEGLRVCAGCMSQASRHHKEERKLKTVKTLTVFRATFGEREPVGHWERLVHFSSLLWTYKPILFQK
jgi:hypothetical protein